jgi:hypothetical protein
MATKRKAKGVRSNPPGDVQDVKAHDTLTNILNMLKLHHMYHVRLGRYTSFTIRQHSDGDHTAFVLGDDGAIRGPEMVLPDNESMADAYHYALHYGTLEGWRPGSQGVRENPGGKPHTHFRQLVSKFSKRGDITDPKALAAWIEKGKHGKGWPHSSANPTSGTFYMPVLANGQPTQSALDLYGITGKHMTAGDAREANKALAEAGRPERFKPWTKAKMKAFSGLYLKNALRQNPDSDSASASAAAMYSTFHGTPSTETLRYTEVEEYEDDLATLGEMVSIKLETPGRKSKEMELGFDGCHVLLACNPAGTQLYLVGGDQSVELADLGIKGNAASKVSVNLGTAVEITYRTQKAFDQFQAIEYFHQTSEETKDIYPVIVYDTANQSLKIVGGSYRVEDVGICD